MNSMFLLFLISNSFHFLKAAEWQGPYLVCSGKVELGWIARSNAPNAYDFAKSKRWISSGDPSKYQKLGRCRCVQASSGDWYANCFEGLTPDGQPTNGTLSRKERLPQFQNNFPALCFAAEACPDDSLEGYSDATPILKQSQPQLACANGIPIGLVDQQQNLRESMAKDPVATGCTCRSAGTALVRDGTNPVPADSGNTRIQLVCEQQFADSILPYCADIGKGCGTNYQSVGYQK